MKIFISFPSLYVKDVKKTVLWLANIINKNGHSAIVAYDLPGEIWIDQINESMNAIYRNADAITFLPGRPGPGMLIEHQTAIYRNLDFIDIIYKKELVSKSLPDSIEEDNRKVKSICLI